MPTVTVNDNTIHYTDCGKGTPLVLVHGFPLDSRIWDEQARSLCNNFRVIVPDLTGFGQSKAARPFSIASLAEDLHAMLKQIDALPCVLAGLSMGGYVAFEYEVKYPTDLQGLILVDTRCEADTAEGRAGRIRMAEVARAQGSSAIADQMEPKMTAPDIPTRKPQVVSRLRQIMEQCPSETIANALMAMHDRADYRDKLASISVPVLVVVGDCDVISPPALAKAMVNEMPHAQLAIIPNAGHMAPIEEPQQVTEAIRSFVQQKVEKRS